MPRTAQFPSPAAILPTLERGGVNIDAYSVDADEIWRLALCLSRHATAAARAMFPEKPPGFRRATVSLGHYAFNKSTAMKCRARGEIYTAQHYESICEQIYKRLPDFARW